MGGGNFTELAVWVFILALIAFFTWVRKLMEKSRKEGTETRGKGIGAAVRAQIEKYMRAVEDSPMGRGFGTTTPPVPERRPPPKPAPAARSPELLPPREAVREIERKAARAASAAAPPLAVTRGRRSATQFRLTGKSVRDAVVLAELLGPPMAERRDYRLF